MNLRGFYKATGVCALVYAAVSLLSYALWVSASGFLAVTATPPSPDRLLSLLQLSGNQLSTRLDGLSFFFLIPAGVGLLSARSQTGACPDWSGVSRLLNCWAISSLGHEHGDG